MRRGMESDERVWEKWRQWRVFAFGIERVVFGMQEFFCSALSVEKERVERYLWICIFFWVLDRREDRELLNANQTHLSTPQVLSANQSNFKI